MDQHLLFDLHSVQREDTIQSDGCGVLAVREASLGVVEFVGINDDENVTDCQLRTDVE